MRRDRDEARRPDPRRRRLPRPTTRRADPAPDPKAVAARQAEEREAVLARFHVSRETTARLDRYMANLQTWQARINLVAPSTLPGAWERHIADSLAVEALLPDYGQAIDLGAGAGLPGMIVAAARPEMHMDFVEANAKKAAFLRTVRADLGIAGTVHAARIEDSGSALGNADLVLARALAPLDALCGLVQPHLSPGTRCFFQKGREHAAEIDAAAANWRFTMIKHESGLADGSVVLEIADITPR